MSQQNLAQPRAVGRQPGANLRDDPQRASTFPFIYVKDPSIVQHRQMDSLFQVIYQSLKVGGRYPTHIPGVGHHVAQLEEARSQSVPAAIKRGLLHIAKLLQRRQQPMGRALGEAGLSTDLRKRHVPPVTGQQIQHHQSFRHGTDLRPFYRCPRFVQYPRRFRTVHNSPSAHLQLADHSIASYPWGHPKPRQGVAPPGPLL